MTHASAQSNRRLTARQACRLTVRYRRGKDWRPATAMDVSRAGCRLRLGESLPRGSAVSVAFELPVKDGSRLVGAEVSGQVMWSRLEGLSHQAGIQFGSGGDALDEILATIQ